MKLKHCKKAEIFTLNEHPLCIASVHTDEEKILLEIDYSNIELLESEAMVTFYDNTLGLLTYHCSFSNPKRRLSSDGHWIASIVCFPKECISTIERRSDYKYPVHLSIQANIIFTPMLSNQHLNDLKKIPCTIHNLSAGGILLASTHNFLLNQVIQFEFALNSNSAISLEAEIIRLDSKNKSTNPDIQFFGCRFKNLPTGKEDAIRRFVFQQEVLSLK